MQALSPLDPARIGPYRTVAELGSGAMGRVLLAYGPDGRLVAVKLVREWLLEDEEFRARFRREIKASRRVRGNHTAAVVDAAPAATIPWLASEFLPGPTLQEAVDSSGAFPERAVLRLAAGLASALASIHEAGVIHRDLKPGNVIITCEGPRVIDFGIARAVEQRTVDLTRTGGVLGTPGYMSPEQADSAPLTTASDVFSLGSVLVLAATGSGPFDDDSTLRTLNNVVRAEPDLTAVPEGIREIAQRCLAKDPTRRPTATELLDAIGPVPSEPWPDPVNTLARKQDRELSRIFEATGRSTTRLDGGSTMVVDAERPTLVDPRRPEPRRSGGFGRLAVALVGLVVVLVAGLLTGVFMSLPDGGSSSEGESPEGQAADVVENGDWVPRFQGARLELPSYVRYGNTCFWGVMDLNAENPMPMELDGEVPEGADLGWFLCSAGSIAWEGAEPCDPEIGCRMVGEVVMTGDNHAAVVSDVDSMGPEECREAAQDGGTAQGVEGDGWNVKVHAEVSLSSPDLNGICIDTGDELFLIEFGGIDHEGTSLSNDSFFVYVDSWTPA